MMDVDVIPLRVPQDKGHQLYVSPFRWEGDQEDVQHEMRKVFECYGPVHRVTARRGGLSFATEEQDNVWYGYVAYFSTFDLEEALRHTGKIMVGDSAVRVRRKESVQLFKDMALPLHRSQQLLTYYFGFNCWTSEIVHLERDTSHEEKDCVRYMCFVRVRMPREGLCSEGLGVNESPYNTRSPCGRGEAIQCARRFAFNSAMKAAFGKFIIVRLRNGKVLAEVDTTQTDLQIYKPAWDNPAVLVNDIDYDPEEEDSDDDFMLLEDIDDDDLQAMLDATTTQHE